MEDAKAAKQESAEGKTSASAAAGQRRNRREIAAILFFASVGLIIVGFRFAGFALFSIPSSSMYPTLVVGDYLIVSKYSYGYSRHSFPFELIQFEGRIWENPVERGDVAVFRNPADISEDYIKRIVGLPGDRIQLRSGILHINGAPVERERVEDYELTPGRMAPQYLETLPNGRTYRLIETLGDTSMLDHTLEFAVPPGHYFALGDNRDNSADSRMFGPVPAENLIGRVEVLFFSSDGFDVRFDRIFHGVE